MSARERRGVCRFCGRRMIIDDANRAIHHEAPLCHEFGKALRGGPAPSGTGLSIDVEGEMVVLARFASEKS